MQKRGYRTVKEECALDLGEFQAFLEIQERFLREIDSLPSRRITESELIRDLKYSATGLKMLKAAKYFRPASANGARRLTYDLKEALRLRVRLTGFAAAPTTKLKRKHANITSVVRDIIAKVVKNTVNK